jgi:LacI family transcriptional regulator
LAKTRLADVAKLAGVSAATASRAINSPEKVSATRRDRVVAAVDALHYVPHGAARALASRRSRTIGAVVPTLDIAIFAAGVVAVGALQECRTLGVRVPEEVSVTGFDDLDLAVHLEPPLTTVRVPAAELGEKAADYLLTRIQGGAVPDRVELTASLIVRGSTGRPRG